jgi:tetratricopeptide (TPR) repeat protein
LPAQGIAGRATSLTLLVAEMPLAGADRWATCRRPVGLSLVKETRVMSPAAKHFGPAIVAVSILLAASAQAQTPQERRMCDGEDGATVEQRIAGCTAVIKSAKGDKLAEAFDLRGVAYRSQGEHNLAIADYNQAIKLNPKFAPAYHNRGVAYDHKGDYDRAIQDFDQAIKLKPSALAHFNRGNAHLGKSQFDQAIDDYNQAIRLKPDFAAALDNRCWARAVTGVLKQALADCNEALRLVPSNAATLESRGFIFLKMTNFDAAVSDYEAALRRNPSLAGALYGRGIAKLKNEDATGEADIAEEYARYGIRDTR